MQRGYSPAHALPHRLTLRIAALNHRVQVATSVQVCIFAVLFEKQSRRAPDVDFFHGLACLMTGHFLALGSPRHKRSMPWAALILGGDGMATDRYTKTVLTVIAVALVWLAFKDSILPPAWAQGTVSVRIVGGRLDYETDTTGGPTLKVCTQC